MPRSSEYKKQTFRKNNKNVLIISQVKCLKIIF